MTTFIALNALIYNAYELRDDKIGYTVNHISYLHPYPPKRESVLCLPKNPWGVVHALMREQTQTR